MPLYPIDSNKLFSFGLDTLKTQGWVIERIPKCGKSSLRRISKGQVSHVVCLKTSQNGSIGFQRNDVGGWVTLTDADVVVVVSLDVVNPLYIKVHFFSARDVEEQLNRRYQARKDANHKLSEQHSIWLELYSPDKDDLPSYVGNGLGLNPETMIAHKLVKEIVSLYHPTTELVGEVAVEEPLTIAEAKKRLASTYSVDVSAIKIIIEM